MSCSGSNTLSIGRSTQGKFDELNCGSGGVTATTGSCGGGTPACGSFVAPQGRKLSARKHREKVREQIKDYVLLMLGAPVVKVELDQQNLDLAVDQALMIFEDFAPRDYFDYHTFRSTPGKSVYKLPDDVGIVRNVFYMEQGANFAFNSSDLGGSLPLEYMYPGSASAQYGGMLNPVQPMWGNMGEWVLFKQYENMYARTSSQTGGWEWVSDMGHIKLYPIPCRSQPVMVHYLQKCKDFKQVTQGMQEGALAHAMIMLGHIRGKYKQPPGPGGGMSLDGEYMLQKGWELKKQWQEDLIYRYGDLPSITLD